MEENKPNRIVSENKGFYIDSKTGLFNQKYLMECCMKELSRAKRHKYSLSVTVIKLDYRAQVLRDSEKRLKNIIDEIGRFVRKSMRFEDIAGYYEDDKIGLLMPYSTRKESFNMMERLRKKFYQHPMVRKYKVKLTLSFGMASYPYNASTVQHLFDKAMDSLTLASESGGNQVRSSVKIEKDAFKLAFCPPSFNSSFYSNVLSGVREVLEDVGNIDLKIDAPDKESDYESLRQILEKHIRNKVGAIAVCTMASELLKETVQKAYESEIPVFFFNTPKNLFHDKVASYIGYNQMEAGRKVGRYLSRLMRKKGKLAIIDGLPEETSMERMSGFMEVIKECPEIEIVDIIRADWEREKARKAAERIFRSHSDVDSFFALNDEMALGITDTLEEKDKQGKVFVVGLDGTTAAKDSIREGKLTATLDTHPVEMGKILMRSILRYKIKKERVSRNIRSPITMVDEENLEFAFK